MTAWLPRRHDKQMRWLHADVSVFSADVGDAFHQMSSLRDRRIINSAVSKRIRSEVMRKSISLAMLHDRFPIIRE